MYTSPQNKRKLLVIFEIYRKLPTLMMFEFEKGSNYVQSPNDDQVTGCVANVFRNKVRIRLTIVAHNHPFRLVNARMLSHWDLASSLCRLYTAGTKKVDYVTLWYVQGQRAKSNRLIPQHRTTVIISVRTFAGQDGVFFLYPIV